MGSLGAEPFAVLAFQVFGGLGPYTDREFVRGASFQGIRGLIFLHQAIQLPDASVNR
jgi:hypothetical protein